MGDEIEVVLEKPNKISITLPAGKGTPVRVKRWVSAADLMKVLASKEEPEERDCPGWLMPEHF